jgi:RNA-binding protein
MNSRPNSASRVPNDPAVGLLILHAFPHPAFVTELNNKQISHLKGLGQLLEPVARVGHAGLSDAFIASLNKALDDHELVKVKFSDFKDQKKELSPKLAELTNSRLIMRVGNVAVLYREQADPAKRKIQF